MVGGRLHRQPALPPANKTKLRHFTELFSGLFLLLFDVVFAIFISFKIKRTNRSTQKCIFAIYKSILTLMHRIQAFQRSKWALGSPPPLSIFLWFVDLQGGGLGRGQQFGDPSEDFYFLCLPQKTRRRNVWPSKVIKKIFLAAQILQKAEITVLIRDGNFEIGAHVQ